MKPNFFALAIASGFWIAPHTVAVVYVPGVSLHSPTPWRSSFGAETAPFPTFGAGFSVRVDEFFSMSPVPNYYTAGIGQEWFEVAAGTAINHEFVINHIPFASSLRATSGDPIWLDFDVPFLLGFWLHSSVPEASRYDTYGWAKVKYTEAGLVLIDSAKEDSRMGLYAGTTTVVPEPSCFTLLLFSFAFVPAITRAFRAAG